MGETRTHCVITFRVSSPFFLNDFSNRVPCINYLPLLIITTTTLLLLLLFIHTEGKGKGYSKVMSILLCLLE